MGFRQRAAVIARYVKTVSDNALGVWVGVGTPELAAVSAQHNTIVLWDELNPGLYGALYSQGGTVRGAYFDGAGAALEEAFYWQSGGLVIPAGKSLSTQSIVSATWGAAWHSVAFQNGWTNFDAAESQWRHVGYSLDPLGIVHLRGLATCTLAVGSTSQLFVLDPGYRPAKDEIFPVILQGGLTARLSVSASTGSVQLEELSAAQQAAAKAYSSLGGVTFATF